MKRQKKIKQQDKAYIHSKIYINLEGTNVYFIEFQINKEKDPVDILRRF